MRTTLKQGICFIGKVNSEFLEMLIIRSIQVPFAMKPAIVPHLVKKFCPSRLELQLSVTEMYDLVALSSYLYVINQCFYDKSRHCNTFDPINPPISDIISCSILLHSLFWSCRVPSHANTNTDLREACDSNRETGKMRQLEARVRREIAA